MVKAVSSSYICFRPIARRSPVLSRGIDRPEACCYILFFKAVLEVAIVTRIMLFPGLRQPSGDEA